MQVLLVLVGLVLVGVGLVFAVTGVGSDRAEGEGRGVTLKAPAWLFLVVIGVLLMWFAGTRDWGGDGPDPTTPPTVTETTDPPPRDTTVPTSSTDPPNTSVLATDCEIGIGNPLASIRIEPDPFARELGRIPAGTYPVLEIRDVEFVNEQRWFLIEVDGQQGWIMDSTILIDSKTAACND